MATDGRQAKSDRYWLQSASTFEAHYEGGWVTRRFLLARGRALVQWLRTGAEARVADVGCGSGRQMTDLARRSKEVVGFDYSPPMLDMARRRFAAEGIANVAVVLSDAYQLKSGSAEFDGVVCLGLLDYLEDPSRALREIHRIGKAGAQVIFSVPAERSPFSLLRRGVGLWLREYLLNLPPILTAVSRAALDRMAAESGLRIVSTRRLWGTMWMVDARIVK